MATKKLIIIGGEGKGGPVVACVQHNREHYQDFEYEIYGFLNDFEEGSISGFPILGKTSDYTKYLKNDSVFFVFAIHLIGKNKVAEELFNNLEIPRERFARIIHKSAVIAFGVKVEPGVVILAQSYISPNAHLKFGTLVMAGGIICHNAEIGPLTYISIGAIVGSYAKIGKCVSVSMGANVIEMNTVRDYAVIAAGAVVNSNVPSESIYGGIPAKFIRKIDV